MRIRMGCYQNQEKRMNVNGDRLSNLSDDLIHKIFSSIDTKLVVQTSVLSSRWRSIWTSMPFLNISSQDFSTLPETSKFVTHFLSRRDYETEVSSVKLNVRGSLGDGYIKDIMVYAFSHNIQKLNLSYFRDTITVSLPNSVSFSNIGIGYFPSLTTLYFDNVEWHNDGPFSMFPNLKNLTLKNCGLVNLRNYYISHPRVSNLTLDNCFTRKFVNVVAPKLEKLTIRNLGILFSFVEVSAPHLTSFVYRGDYYTLRLSTDGFNSLKKADIHVSTPTYEHSQDILCLLRHLHNVKFLALNLGIVELLASYVRPILDHPIVFTNLKRLKICSQSTSSQTQTPNKSYFLDSSPGATIEEIIAQSLVVELWVILKQEKANTKTIKTRMKRGKDPMESHDDAESVTEKIESCLEHLREQIDERKSKYRYIISKLQKIKEAVTKLPASKRDLIQPCLDSLYAEAVIVMGGIKDLMKSRCDENESRISVCVQELATTLKPSY